MSKYTHVFKIYFYKVKGWGKSQINEFEINQKIGIILCYLSYANFNFVLCNFKALQRLRLCDFTCRYKGQVRK